MCVCVCEQAQQQRKSSSSSWSSSSTSSSINIFGELGTVSALSSLCVCVFFCVCCCRVDFCPVPRSCGRPRFPFEHKFQFGGDSPLRERPQKGTLKTSAAASSSSSTRFAVCACVCVFVNVCSSFRCSSVYVCVRAAVLNVRI